MSKDDEQSFTPLDDSLPASALPLPHEVLIWRGMKATPTVVLIDAFTIGDELEKALIEETARRRRAEILLQAMNANYARAHERVMELSAQSESTRLGWVPVSETPKGDDLYVVRDVDGQMAFASWTKRYGWEHVADNDCGAVDSWYPLPSPQPEETR